MREQEILDFREVGVEPNALSRRVWPEVDEQVLVQEGTGSSPQVLSAQLACPLAFFTVAKQRGIRFGSARAEKRDAHNIEKARGLF